MPAVSYNYSAFNCPALVANPALLDPNGGGAVPTTWENIISGTSSGVGATGLARLVRNFIRGDNTGRYGTGAYAIAEGLVPSVSSGLTLAISAGAAMIDGPVFMTAATQALSDNTTSYLWLLQGGTFSVLSTSTPPAGASVFIARITTSGGAITEIDQSGVLFFRGAELWRKTGDTGTPADTPPARYSFRLETAAGARWLWNGSVYALENEWPLQFQAVGVLTSSQVLGWRVADRPVTLPISLTGSAVKAQVAATASTVLTIKKNGSSIGTLTFAISGTVPTIVFASAVSLVSGDVVSVSGPGSADATLADVAITLRGFGQ